MDILFVFTIAGFAITSIGVCQIVNEFAIGELNNFAFKKGFVIKRKGKKSLDIFPLIPGINLIVSAVLLSSISLMKHSKKFENKFFKKFNNYLEPLKVDSDETEIDDTDYEFDSEEKSKTAAVPSVIILSPEDYTITSTDEKVTFDSKEFTIVNSPETFETKELFEDLFKNFDENDLKSEEILDNILKGGAGKPYSHTK